MAFKLPSMMEETRVRSEVEEQVRLRLPHLLRKLRHTGLLFLALSILLSGSAYKLSLYRVHSDPVTRVSIAKLWLETRSTRAVTDVLRRVKVEWPPVAAHGFAARQHTVLVDLGPRQHDPREIQPQTYFVSLPPSRSPPQPRLCLA